MQVNLRGAELSKLLLGVIAALVFCAFQFGDRYGLNNMPFARVQSMVSDLAKVRRPETTVESPRPRSLEVEAETVKPRRVVLSDDLVLAKPDRPIAAPPPASHVVRVR